MGTGSSTPKKEAATMKSSPTSSRTLHKNQNEIVHLMMPLYYSTKTVTSHERELAVQSWNLIVMDKTPVFIANKGKPDFKYHSGVTFFYDSFYSRLFDMHPMCKQLFKSGMRSQGTFLVKMISLALSELEDQVKFDNTLKRLAEIHHERGVKAMEYGIVGEVLFWVLHHVLGDGIYSRDVHIAWVKIYNRMIRTIIPVAVALEVNCGASDVQEDREYEDCMFPGHEAGQSIIKMSMISDGGISTNCITNNGCCWNDDDNGRSEEEEESLKDDNFRAVAMSTMLSPEDYPNLHSSKSSYHVSYC